LPAGVGIGIGATGGWPGTKFCGFFANGCGLAAAPWLPIFPKELNSDKPAAGAVLPAES
jgi:hypothetical protein